MPPAKLYAELSAYLEGAGIDCLPLLQKDLMLLTGDALSTGKLICVDADKTEGFVNLRDVKRNTVLTLPEHGVLIPKRMSESFGLQNGDTVTLFDERMNGRETEVSGVYNNYFLYTVVMTPQSYEKIFGRAAEHNTMFVRLNGTDFSEFLRGVQSIDGVLSVTEDVGRAQMESGTNAMNAVVAMMIVAAGMMAYFIQVNLTESYMIHKKKELTVMRINGFTVKECVRYASQEMTVTTALGILLGLPVGAFFGYLVIRGSEADYMQFVRSIDLRSIVISALITALFSALINAHALRRIRTLKLSDV